jgi:hypothetical protein
VRHKRHHIFAVSASAFDGFRLGLLLLDFLLLHRQRCICGAARPTRGTGATPTGRNTSAVVAIWVLTKTVCAPTQSLTMRHAVRTA